MKTLLFIIIILSILGCKKEYLPKPKGYFRIAFQEKEYQSSTLEFPYQFEYPKYSELKIDNSPLAEPYWLNIDFKKNNSKIHISYKKVNNDLFSLTEESRELAYKHSIKATAINEKQFINEANKVYGTIYEIKGNTASPMQFHLTDSMNHFLRASFYISEIPNYDSLQPVIKYIEEDIYHFIETFNWN